MNVMTVYRKHHSAVGIGSFHRSYQSPFILSLKTGGGYWIVEYREVVIRTAGHHSFFLSHAR